MLSYMDRGAASYSEDDFDKCRDILTSHSHVTHAPVDAVAILVWVKLYHRKNVEDDFHSAQKVFAVVDDMLIRNEDAASRKVRCEEMTGSAASSKE